MPFCIWSKYNIKIVLGTLQEHHQSAVGFEGKIKTQLINILNFLDSSKLYRRLLANPKTGCSRKFFLPENDFKGYSAKLFMPTDPTKMWNWDLKVYQQKHPQIGKSYIRKMKNYLSDAKPKILL